MNQKSNSKHYIPALTSRWLTPLYDPLIKWTMPENSLKRRLIERANIQAGQSILDLGSGTGTLAILIKQTVPQAQVSGLDADPDILSIAKTKAEQAGVNLKWDHA